MKRQGNFLYHLDLGQMIYLVHRGVSQGGRKLSPKARERWWQKKTGNGDLPEGMYWMPSSKYAGPALVMSMEALRFMRERSLIIVANPAKPQILTPKRIIAQGVRVDGIPATAISAGTSRRGLLQL